MDATDKNRLALKAVQRKIEDAGLYGKVVLHVQEGRIVRFETRDMTSVDELAERAENGSGGVARAAGDA